MKESEEPLIEDFLGTENLSEMESVSISEEELKMQLAFQNAEGDKDDERKMDNNSEGKKKPGKPCLKISVNSLMKFESSNFDNLSTHSENLCISEEWSFRGGCGIKSPPFHIYSPVYEEVKEKKIKFNFEVG